MRIDQKRFANRTAFEFAEETLTFTLEDKGGSVDFEVAYADIPTKAATFVERSAWLRNAGLLWVLIGGLQIAYAVYRGASLSGSGFWLLVGLICLAAYWICVTKYSTLKTSNGTIYVIRDGKHDDIVDEIGKRRVSQLRLWYADVDPNNDPNREIAKFNWLVENSVITRAEADVLIAKVRSSQRGEPLTVQTNVTH